MVPRCLLCMVIRQPIDIIPRVLTPIVATSEEGLREWLQDWEREGYGYWAITLLQSEDVAGFWRSKTYDLARSRCVKPVLSVHSCCMGPGICQRNGTESGRACAKAYAIFACGCSYKREEHCSSIRVAERAGLQRCS